VQPEKLVLLPGLDGSGRLFGPFIDCVADFLDPSPFAYPADRLWGYDELLPFVLERLPPGRSIVLGESFSGPLAVMLAAAAPDRVAAVVLVSSFTRLPVPRAAAAAARFVDAARCPAGAIDLALTSRTTPAEMRSELLRQVRSLSSQLVERRLRAVFEADTASALGRLACPVLAIHGRSDRLVPLWWAKRDLGRIRSVAFRVVDGPHMLLQTSPRSVACVLVDWIGTMARSSSLPGAVGD
jgi:pimeloyl-[acyl-carrier protein] methyl ester esterase